MDQIALLNGSAARQEARLPRQSLSPGTKVAQTKSQRRNEAMRRQRSTEFLSPLQVAELLGMSAWNLLLWRKKGFGPPFFKITRNMIRYPRVEFEAWLASLRPTA